VPTTPIAEATNSSEGVKWTNIPGTPKLIFKPLYLKAISLQIGDFWKARLRASKPAALAMARGAVGGYGISNPTAHLNGMTARLLDSEPARWGLSACTCQLSEVWVGSLAVMQLHSASRNATPFNLNHLRCAACDAVFVLVLAKAGLRLARAKTKRDKAHGQRC
jgi:hypothetical protein